MGEEDDTWAIEVVQSLHGPDQIRVMCNGVWVGSVKVDAELRLFTRAQLEARDRRVIKETVRTIDTRAREVAGGLLPPKNTDTDYWNGVQDLLNWMRGEAGLSGEEHR